MWRVGVIVYHEEGVSAFYRGLSLNYIRAIPMVGISFTAFEFFKQLLRIEEHGPTSWQLCTSTSATVQNQATAVMCNETCDSSGDRRQEIEYQKYCPLNPCPYILQNFILVFHRGQGINDWRQTWPARLEWDCRSIRQRESGRQRTRPSTSTVGVLPWMKLKSPQASIHPPWFFLPSPGRYTKFHLLSQA